MVSLSISSCSSFIFFGLIDGLLYSYLKNLLKLSISKTCNLLPFVFISLSLLKRDQFIFLPRSMSLHRSSMNADFLGFMSFRYDRRLS